MGDARGGTNRNTGWPDLGPMLLTAFLIGGLPSNAYSADEQLEALKRQVERLQRELKQVQEALSEKEREEGADQQDLSDLKQEVREISKTHSEWKNAESVAHLSGYGAVGYTDSENGDGTFDTVNFNPIFHYQYKDLFLLEAELEVAVDDTGETETALEYGAIDWFINDYAVLQAGKFLSPVGQFRQNLHPAWINKFASAPPGFGHDGAAPVSEVGAQVRGGTPISGPARVTYAAYLGNGPTVEISNGEIHGVEAEGSTGNDDGELVAGGRLGFLPTPSVEVGLSAAGGEVGPEGEETLLRDYEVYGADFSWRPTKHWDLRGEYVNTEVGANGSSAAPESTEWETWYVQGGYRFLPSKWEAVLRHGDFDSPHADDDQRQWGLGLNYWFAPNAVFKAGFESNDGLAGEPADDDRWLLQLAYGF